MCEPFMRNHQYNSIIKQLGILQHTLRTVTDRKVVSSVRSGTEEHIASLLPDSAEGRKRLLEDVSRLETADDFRRYAALLEPYREEFPRVTKEQLLKLFPKNKKLKIPDLASLDYRNISYLSWVDIAANKLFLVYPLDGRLVGVEGRFTSTHKKNYCFVCNRFEELALFTAITKKRPAFASPDYYKAVGNYLCLDGHVCNNNMTDTEALERFIRTVIE
ncbi:FusB/FusC family EF-G-binding protein [Cohnella candidum]|uniref:Elongation factor G-binding protein n=1 Tax=Cohnella candidum TaxID=2674991 RepID=A0A3G3JVU3_9BACL|nr:FusB/FusC family EF-G-binding protein [Cohnella candidum]AYQ72304.1 elongation factor G-binding protein [Cohnella candidum]